MALNHIGFAGTLGTGDQLTAEMCGRFVMAIDCITTARQINAERVTSGPAHPDDCACDKCDPPPPTKHKPDEDDRESGN